ncbi:MAG TPA: helix-turn-helix domain-containing protein, partial [Gemmataceae bacterium]|nr:helix-turn-helix domain-containing protein [Gemmataceae bacterium]
AVVLAHGQSLTGDLLASPSGRGGRPRMGRSRGGDIPVLIQKLVRAGIQSIPNDEGHLYVRLVGGVERELIQQIMLQCDNVQVKAAARLGINRNTLHKKISEYLNAAEGNSNPHPD